MRCETHGLAAGEDGRCALCRSHERRVAHRASERRWRPLARVVVAIVAGLFVFAWLLAVFDTQPKATHTPDAGTIDAAVD